MRLIGTHYPWFAMPRVKVLPYKKVWDPKLLSPLSWRSTQSWGEGLEMLVACTSRGDTIALGWKLGGEGVGHGFNVINWLL